ncbi:hypothetical protein Sjap_015347 [Stephania japonica]|uniref:Uncharacterized protein n=1 Tax=Stephania japonica TaxID=461633 RepID=A0AAP0IJQ6_9MAGN
MTKQKMSERNHPSSQRKKKDAKDVTCASASTTTTTGTQPEVSVQPSRQRMTTTH